MYGNGTAHNLKGCLGIKSCYSLFSHANPRPLRRSHHFLTAQLFFPFLLYKIPVQRFLKLGAKLKKNPRKLFIWSVKALNERQMRTRMFDGKGTGSNVNPLEDPYGIAVKGSEANPPVELKSLRLWSNILFLAMLFTSLSLLDQNSQNDEESCTLSSSNLISTLQTHEQS